MSEIIEVYRPGSPGGEMKCPTCGQNTPDDWKRLYSKPGGPHPFQPQAEIAISGDETNARGYPIAKAFVSFDWMFCANKECGELVIRMHEAEVVGPIPEMGDPDMETRTVTVRPRFGVRQIPAQVGEPFRTDFAEAVALLELSPRMSAVLSRRVLYDLLERYAGIAEYTLAGSVDKFVADTSRPTEIRKDLHYLRELGDFGAHTKKDGDDQIIAVNCEDAEWSLDVIERLFDYFIVGPDASQRMRAEMDRRLAEAGRKPIKPLPDEEVTSE